MNREQIIQMARDAAHHDVQGLFLEFIVELERFAALVASHEREQCAKVCEARQTPGTGSVAILNGAADAIRARGQQ